MSIAELVINCNISRGASLIEEKRVKRIREFFYPRDTEKRHREK